jgi:hypothetical protein
MTMAMLTPEQSARQSGGLHGPGRAGSGIRFKIDRIIRYAWLCLARSDVWPTCLCAVLACLTWLGLGMVLFGQPLPGSASPLDCSAIIECAMRAVNLPP